MASQTKKGNNIIRQRPRDRRTAIVQSALKLFASKGIAETSIPDIAEAANVAVGTLYCYFASKEALANFLITESSQAMCKYLWDGFPFSATYRHQFSFFWRRYLVFAVEHPATYTYLHHRAKDFNQDKTSKKAMKTLEEIKNWIIDRGIATEELRPMPKVALNAILHGTANALIQAHLKGQLKLDEITITQTEQCCWQAVTMAI
ncbi:MAG: TetR/AcrR family transcriptional regulator [Holophagaceae bacterium]|nr:TetR/AcrR family transcriptional regulator [Holophagaceae bacterium]